MGAGWIVKTILSDPTLPFPHGHATLFVFYCAAMIPALGSFIAIHEPPDAVDIVSVTLKKQLRRARQVWGENRTYRRHLFTRLALALSNTALPFYGIYAKQVLGAPVGMVGVYVSTRVGAQLLCTLPWGKLSDRCGNRLTMRLQSLGKGLTALLALGLVWSVGGLHLHGDWLPYLALPLFALDGALRPAQVLTGSNFLLELVPQAERPLYLGFSNTILGVTVFLSGLGGLVVDLLGFTGLFVASLLLCLGGYVLATGLPEPRLAAERTASLVAR